MFTGPKTSPRALRCCAILLNAGLRPSCRTKSTIRKPVLSKGKRARAIAVGSQTAATEDVSFDHSQDETFAQRGGPSPRMPHIPFEKLARSDPHAGFEDTTITPSERKAFQGLFELHPEAKSRNVLGRARAAKSALDKILDVAIQSIDSSSPQSRLPKALLPMAKKARTAQHSAKKQETPVRNVVQDEEYSHAQAAAAKAEKDRKNISELMGAASTDADVWHVLQSHILNRVEALGLDKSIEDGKSHTEIVAEGTPSGQGNKKWLDAKQSPDQGTTSPANQKRKQPGDLEVLAINLPDFLVDTVRFLCKSFPDSSLPLAILPTLRNLGPSAFALGISPTLYNDHMRILFVRHTDLDGIVDILVEMDSQVHEFNSDTLDILIEILVVAKRAVNGIWGPSVQAIWQTERMTAAVRHLRRWCSRVRDRVEEEVSRAAREQEDADREQEDVDREHERNLA